MATENLDLVISVLDRFSDDLNELLLKLTEVEVALDRVDGRQIDLDPLPAIAALESLRAELALLQMQLGMGPNRVGRFPMGGGGPGAEGLDLDLDLDTAPLRRRRGAAGRSLANLSEAADRTAEGFDITNIRMSTLHNWLAALVPLLIVFIGAIPALLGALVALAAAAIAAAAGLAALAGFGALGFAITRAGVDDIGEGLREILDEIQEDFLDAFAPLAQRLTPLFERALDGLDRLFEAIAARGDVLVAFADTAADFGRFVQDFLPDLLADMGKMARAFGPFFGEIMEVFDFSVLGALTDFMADSSAEIILFLELLVPFIALIADLSIGFLMVVNAIGAFLQGIGQLLNILGISPEIIGAVIASLLTAATAMFIVGKAGLASAIGVTSLTSALVVLSRATIFLTAFALIVPVIADHFNLLGNNIDSATDSLREFNRVGDDLGRNPFADPNLMPGQVRAPTGRGGGNITVNIEGNADEEMVQTQTGNALYKMERKRRGR